MPRKTDIDSFHHLIAGAGSACGFPLRTAGSACRLVQMLTGEMIAIAGERVPLRRDRRRSLCHARQIAMYICHVALQIPQSEVGAAFGKDRSTVGYACGVVEDRRDDRAFDDFVTALERISREMIIGERQDNA